MADINQILGQQINSVKELKGAISELQNSLIGVDTESEQYKKTSAQLAAAQAELNKVTKAGKQENDAAADSVAGMEKQYKELYKTYKTLTDEQRKSPIGKAMAKDLSELSEKINDTKKDVGNFTSNIGHYAEGVTEAFGKMGVSIGALEGPLNLATKGSKGLNDIWKVISKNPILTIMTVLVAVFSKIVEKIKGSEEMTNRLKVAFAGIKPVVEAVTNAFNWLVDKVVKVAEGIGKVIEKVLSLNPKLREQIRLSKEAAAANQDLVNSTEETSGALSGTSGALSGVTYSYGKATTAASAYTEAVKDGAEEAERLYKQLQERNKSEIRKLEDKYHEQRKLLIENGYDTVELEKKFLEDRQALYDKAEEEAKAKREAARKKEEELLQQSKDGFKYAAEAKKEAWMDAAVAITASLDGLLSSIENLMQAELNSGKLTEEQAKKKQRALKALQKVQLAVSIATIAADVATGIAKVWANQKAESSGYFLKYALVPGGPAIAAELAGVARLRAITDTVSLAAQGASQIAAAVGGYISKQSAAASSDSVPVATVPQVAENNAWTYTRNVQSQEDIDELNQQPIYVRVTDIQNGLDQTNNRVVETSF